MIFDMTIRQGDNGWILTFVGHDCLDKEKIFSDWADVLKELEKHFGWYDMAGNWGKINPYCL